MPCIYRKWMSLGRLVWQLKHMFSVFKQHYTIFTHFFIHTYFHTYFQITKHVFLSAYAEHPLCDSLLEGPVKV